MWNSFSALVIDDDPSARNILEKYLEATGKVEVFAGLDSAVDAIEKIELLEPDVIFLDINMPYEDGLQFAARLKKTKNASLLIFCTAFKSYALDAFELRPFDFLVKPFGITDIELLVDKIIREFIQKNDSPDQHDNADTFGKYKLRIPNGYLFIKANEIIFVKSLDAGCRLLTIEGDEISILQRLSNIHSYFGDQHFFKINRGTIVNIDYIVSVERKRRCCLMKVNDFEQEFKISKKHFNILENLLVIKLG
jgi:DNA-binding LytR/AlgR family response regulator